MKVSLVIYMILLYHSLKCKEHKAMGCEGRAALINPRRMRRRVTVYSRSVCQEFVMKQRRPR